MSYSDCSLALPGRDMDMAAHNWDMRRLHLVRDKHFANQIHWGGFVHVVIAYKRGGYVMVEAVGDSKDNSRDSV